MAGPGSRRWPRPQTQSEAATQWEGPGAGGGQAGAVASWLGQLGVYWVFHTSREIKWHNSNRISSVPANCTRVGRRKQERLGGLVTDESHRSAFLFLQDSVKAETWTLRYPAEAPRLRVRGHGPEAPL